VSRQRGWGFDGIVQVPIGENAARVAAVRAGALDGCIVDLASALNFVQRGEGRILLRFGDLVKDFHIHVIFATNKDIAEKPDALRGFLKGWFDTIHFMRANKAEAVDIAKDVIHKDADITAHTYDTLMPMFSDDGKFNPMAMAVLAKSYVELKVLPSEPDPKELVDDRFLPR
jgi:ABC-type nitrate/sulfonate/bicarbonate transport system substrate-binding protein